MLRVARWSLALVLITGPSTAAVVEAPAGDPAAEGAFVAMADRSQTLERPSTPAGLAATARAALLPTGVAVFGAALLGLGLITRRVR
jgi:hypothetical protein